MAKKTNSWANSLGKALSMATSFAAAIALGYYGGKFIDGKLGTRPWFMLALVLLGVVAGMRMMYKQAFSEDMNRPLLEQDDEEEVRRDYRPSAEMIEALGSIKKKIAELDKTDSSNQDDHQEQQ